MPIHNILIAPDSFKGCLKAQQVADALAAGIAESYPEAMLKCLPLADGGEGTLDALAHVGGTFQDFQTQIAAGYTKNARWLWLDENSAVMEVAQTVGIEDLRPESPNVLERHSGPAGEQLRSILEKGVENIYIGLGGSCTSDGGLGLLCQLGLTLLDSDGRDIEPQPQNFDKIHSFLWNPHPLLADARITMLSDVENPLCGPRGACATFGPQKGLQSQDIPTLDECLQKFYRAFEQKTGIPVVDQTGAGAAGGLGAALLSCGATLRPGAEALFELLHFEQSLAWADAIIAGEGRSDHQTLQGKLPQRLALAAQKKGIPVFLVSGSIEQDSHAELLKYFTGVSSIINQPMTLSEALNNATGLLNMAGANLGQMLRWF
jgi:glycerate 2-kinase